MYTQLTNFIIMRHEPIAQRIETRVPIFPICSNQLKKKKNNILLPSKTTISVTVLKIQHPIYKNGCQDEIFSHSNMTQKIEA